MRSHLDSKEVARCVKELIRCVETEICFRPVNTVGREVVNALGKSRSPSAESPVLQLLGDSETRSIRPNILVTVGKIGGSVSIEVLTEFMKRGDLKDSDRMYTSWAMGRLGSVQDNTRPISPTQGTV